MNKEKTLEDVIGFLMNVAEFDLAKTKRVPIPGGAMTVTSENYQFMYEVIEWIDNRLKEQKLNENQEVALEWLKERYEKYNERPSTVIYFLTNHYSFAFEGHGKAKRAFRDLDIAQELQVLQLFSEWALDQC